jgi:biotin carboxylase
MVKKDIVLFINDAPNDAIDAVSKLSVYLKKDLKIMVLLNAKKQDSNIKRPKGVDMFILCDFDKDIKVEKTLAPYKDRLLTVVCRGEKHIESFSKIIPHVPYVRTPTAKSLLWATDKIAMRRLFRVYDRSITPAFAVIKDFDEQTLDKIKKKVGFPLVIKPAGLASSLLVSICFHEEDLELAVKKIFKKINRLYKENQREKAPMVLVEQFMEGEMYSIDAYVSSRGIVHFCPLVHIKTGRTIGFDDFFGYQRVTPVQLKKSTIEDAKSVARKAIHALNLRNVTAHIELIRTERAWKVIEIAPRVGGMRNKLYELSFGIDHALNDILIRIPKKPIIPGKKKGYAAALKIFAKKEGRIEKIQGIRKLKTLESFVSSKFLCGAGDRALFSKHGGKGVCDIFLFNKKYSDLLADIRRIEQSLVIKIK